MFTIPPRNVGTRSFRSRRVGLALLVLVIVSAVPQPKDDEANERAVVLVKQLGDDEYAKRERATEELKKLGEPAIPAVRDGTASDNPEVRLRAHAVMRAILDSVRTSKSIGLEMRPIYPRAFEMGSPKGEPNRRPDEQQHSTRLTHTFLIGAYEVTQGEYEKVMKHNPSWFSAKGGGKNKVIGDTSRYPVEQVSWFDAIEFCNELSKLDGFKPYYQLTDVKRENKSIASAKVTVLGGNGYRLPTEAEWEYACRAGTTTPFFYGRSSGSKSLNAKIFIPGSGYGSSSETIHLNRTAAMGSYARNRWGLYDMHGNAGEWCQDWYDKDYYENAPEDDPLGPKTGTHRVLRGGSWLIADTSCRSAARASHPPGEATYYTGFRVARTP